MKVCVEPGCPELTPTTRCQAHTKGREQRRGTRQVRGYDRTYDLTRLRWVPKVAAGVVTCWSCQTRISPFDAWDLGHCDDDRGVIHGPQHEACNRDTTGLACAHQGHGRHGG